MCSNNAYAGPWSSLPTTLTPWVLDVVNSLGFSSMTPVQASTIPLFMKHKDVVVEAVTGSGKTLSFVIPIIERLIRSESRLRESEIGAFVISPTRELATQIHSVFDLFLKSQRNDECSNNNTLNNGSRPRYASPLLLISSSESSPSDDIKRFLETGADIVVGTPGRVEEFILRKGRDSVSVKNLDVLVLDEADRLLDMGFSQCLTQILSALPKQRRTGLFSATMTDALSELIRVGLRNPVRIVVRIEAKKLKDGKVSRESIEERRTPASLQIFYMVCHPAVKLIQLLRVIEDECRNFASSRFIIYFATCACVDYFYRILSSFRPSIVHFSLHGHIPPSKRSLSLSSFTNYPSTPQSPSILLCTDVAARGLDLPNVDCVIQFDPPVDPKQFSHRCGRTARAGKDGRAWVLLSEREEGYVDFLLVRKIPLTRRSITKLGATDKEDHRRHGEIEEMLSSIRAIIRKDRDLHDKATKAFVSFVRAYSKHEASYIFSMQELDLVGIAKSFGLLRLPKMPEFKGRSIEEWQDDDIDWDAFAYADNIREVRRLAILEKNISGEAKVLRDQENKRKTGQKLKNAAWSDKLQKKSEKFKRKQKKERKKDLLKMQGQHVRADQRPGQVAQGKRTGAAGSEDLDGDDWDELAREERMAKKVKKGTLDTCTFDKEFAGLG